MSHSEALSQSGSESEEGEVTDPLEEEFTRTWKQFQFSIPIPGFENAEQSLLARYRQTYSISELYNRMRQC